jgi:NitT/TauT family transport system substrate-binding protein
MAGLHAISKGTDMRSKMDSFTRRHLLKSSVGVAAGLIAAPFGASAQAIDAIKFSLEFRINGGNAPMFLAAENGIFRKLGLDLNMDGSAGSVESVTRVATGTYPFGVADASTTIEFGARNPAVAPKIIMSVLDRFPAVVLSFKRKPIKTVQDLVGINLGTGTADAGSKILPALLALNKIDPASINRVTVDVKLRDMMLIKGDVDAVIAFDYTAVFNLLENGIKLEDINLLYYSDLGFDLPGNVLIANREIIEKNPDLVRRVARGVAQAWVTGAKNRADAINAVTKRDSLLKPTVERARMDWVIDRLIMTPEVRKNGFGYLDPQRMTKGISVLKEGFQLPQTPTLDQVYDGRFLPSIEDRKFA